MITGASAAEVPEGEDDQEDQGTCTHEQQKVKQRAIRAERNSKAQVLKFRPTTRRDESGKQEVQGDEERPDGEQGTQSIQEQPARTSPSSTPQSLWDQDLLEALETETQQEGEDEKEKCDGGGRVLGVKTSPEDPQSMPARACPKWQRKR